MALNLKNLQLANFKCFKAEKNIDFGKITIFTGANSSGKSSILQAILGVLQSREFPYKFSPNGKYVNLGDFTEISNRHKNNNIIKIGMSFYSPTDKKEYKIDSYWRRNPNNYLTELDKLLVESDFFRFHLYSNNGYLLDYSYDPAKDPSVNNQNQKDFEDNFFNIVRANRNVKTSDKRSQINEEKEIAKGKKLISTLFNKCDLKSIKVEDINNVHDSLLKKRNLRLNLIEETIILNIPVSFERIFNLISSFRLHPSRTYLETSRDKSKVDKFGDGYIDQIVSWEKRNKGKIDELERILKKMGLVNSIKSERIGGGRYEIQLTVKGNGTKTALPDVGFGISQFLPIIIADLQLPNDSTLMVAEPEIHLHPSVQANFADYLIEQSNRKGKNKNYIIETHSEYFLNRIRLAIVKGTLKEEDLKIYYLENKVADVEIHELKFGKRGQIDNAPTSFFDTYMMDLKDIALSVEF